VHKPKKHEENDIYIIPPNFIETETILGGMLRCEMPLRRHHALAAGIPVFKLPQPLTTDYHTCVHFTARRSVALIGKSGESPFFFYFLIYYVL
jgi:hypothetical protein